MIAYFAVAENSDVDAKASASVISDGRGRIEALADMIQLDTGGDLLSIKTSVKYPGDSGDRIDFAQKEQDNNDRPELTSHIENLDDYDVIFVCYPTWWTDMPMAVYSFFDEYDLSGKTIVPFNTHWGYGAADTYQTIAQLEPNADVKDGLSVYNYDMESSESTITDWIDGLGI